MATQITFPMAAAATTAAIETDATTSGPIRIPSWAPDIASMAATTVHGQSFGWFATTAMVPIRFNPGSVYTKRSFNMKTGHAMLVGEDITIIYNAVGELVRT